MPAPATLTAAPAPMVTLPVVDVSCTLPPGASWKTSPMVMREPEASMTAPVPSMTSPAVAVRLTLPDSARMVAVSAIDAAVTVSAPPMLVATPAGAVPAPVTRVTLPPVASDWVAPRLTKTTGADRSMFAAPPPPPEMSTVGTLV